jgi:hypothetical protein
MNAQKDNQTFIALTALWALVESGFGGMMHALHLPFTGIFLGGFSVIIISLIAHFETNSYKKIIQATFIVMAIKASVNPLTSPFAYIAVAFQGFLGAGLYAIGSRNLLIHLLFSIFAMLESAFQKLLVATIWYGDSWHIALDKLIGSILKSINISTESRYALIVVVIYLSLYAIWGVVLGIWIHRLPQKIHNRMHAFDDIMPSLEDQHIEKKRKRRLPIILLSIAMVLLIGFLVPSKNPWIESLTLLIRTTSIVLIWMFVITPLWRKFVVKQLVNRDDENTQHIKDRIPYLSMHVKPLYSKVSKEHKGIHKYSEFVLGLIVISLKFDQYPKQD